VSIEGVIRLVMRLAATILLFNACWTKSFVWTMDTFEAIKAANRVIVSS
jgi:hypothetical protein